MIYAINKRTKEHRVVPEYIGKDTSFCLEDDGERWDVVHADADGWIEWQGGECPLPDGAPYETKHESGAMFEGGKPETFMSHWRGEVGDAVIAYRPILENQESEAPEWDGEGLPPVGIRCEALRSHGWVEVYVVGYCEDGYCVFDTGSEFKGNKDPNKFRPIRSAEDKAVEEMREFLNEQFKAPNKKPSRIELCRTLYRAGYRKTGGE